MGTFQFVALRMINGTFCLFALTQGTFHLLVAQRLQTIQCFNVKDTEIAHQSALFQSLGGDKDMDRKLEKIMFQRIWLELFPSNKVQSLH